MTKLIQWIILALITFLFAHYFVPELVMSDLFLSVILGIGLSFILLLIIFRTYYLHDTGIESPFFSVDRVRSIRYATVYFLIIEVTVFLAILTLPFILAAIAIIVIFLVLLIINLLIGLLFLAMLVIGASGPAFIDLGNSLIAVDYIINLFNVFDLGETALAIILVFCGLVAMVVASYFAGRYVEDTSSAFGMVALINSLIALFGFSNSFVGPRNYINYLGYQFSPILSVAIIASPGLTYFLIQFFFLQKENDSDYELPEVGKYTKKLLTLTSLFLLVSVVGGLVFMSYFSFINFSNGEFYTYMSVIFNGIIGLIFLLFFFWMRIGDFSVDIRIDEIEYREELLRKAKEFKNME